MSKMDIDTNSKNEFLSDKYDQFNFCIDNLPMPIAIIDANNDSIVACNRAMQTFFDLDSKEDLLGKTYIEFSPSTQIDGGSSEEKYPEYKNKVFQKHVATLDWLFKVKELIKKVTLNAKAYQHEGDRYIQISFIDSELFRSSDKLLGEVEKSNDSELADNLLKMSEDTYKKVLDSVNELVYIIGEDNSIIDVNHTVANKYGYEKYELIGRQPDFFAAPDLNDIEEIGKKLTQAFNGKPTSFLFWSKRKDGSIFPKETHAIPSTYFGKKVIIAIGRDVTEKVNIENKLIDSEKRYRTLFELMPQGIIHFGKDGAVIDVNNAACEILGLSLEDIKNRQYILDNVMTLYSDGTSYQADDFPVARALTTGKSVVNEVVQIHNKLQNFKRWITVNAIPLFKPDASIPHQAFVTLEDITLLKKTKLELLKAKDKAEESDRLKSAFLANISHEIRTPMNGIIGFANLLKRPNLTDDKKEHYINIVLQSGRRMLSLINDLVSISKISSKQVDIRNKMTNINQRIDYMFNFFEPEVFEKNMELSVNKPLPDIQANIITDPEKFDAILTNLIKNAIKYSNEGSIELGYVSKGQTIEFYVKDTGIGIPESDIENVFDRFVQAKNVNVNSSKGVGLGLAITKGYVEMLGGKIWVESEQNVGSTFYFTLPLNNT